MMINCTLEKGDINPPQVNFTWHSCSTSKCRKKKLITESYSLRLESQSKTLAYYRCEAKNDAGSTHKDIEIVMQRPTQSESNLLVSYSKMMAENLQNCKILFKNEMHVHNFAVVN